MVMYMNIENINEEFSKVIIEKVAKHIAAQMLLDDDALYHFLSEEFVDTIPEKVYASITETIKATGARWIKEDFDTIIFFDDKTFPEFVSELLSKCKSRHELLMSLNKLSG